MSGVQSKTGSAAVTALLKSKASVAALLSGVGKGDPKKTEDAIRQVQYQVDLQTQILIALASGSDSLSVLGAGGEPIGWIGSDADKVGAWFKNLYVGGTSPDNAQIVADSNGDVTITGALTAASFNVWMPLIESDPFVDNDPAAGRVSWPSFSLFFAGTEYAIASGNTSSSTHRHIYWVRGASALTTATEMPQDIDNYLIASNIGGAHELVLNKPGAGKSITEDALTTSLLKGMQVQPPATATVHIIAGNTGDYELLDVTSGGGVLLAVFFRVITENVTSSPVASLKINVDGTGVQSIKLYNGTNIANSEWDATSGSRGGDMSTIDDYRNMTVLSFPFAESINVTFTLTTQAGAGYLLMRTVYALKTAS